MTDLVMYRGHQWEHEWLLLDGFIPSPETFPSVSLSMRLTLNGEERLRMRVGEGAALVVEADQLKVSFAIGDTTQIDAGTYQYEFAAYDGEGNVLASDSGKLTAVDDAPPQNQDRPARPWDLFNPGIERVSSELRNARMDICRGCPNLHAGICSECGCVMSLKTTLINASCPIGKW